MIGKFKLENCGLLEKLVLEKASSINVIIGENDSGKTFVLKSLYAFAKSLELYQRGDTDKALKKILSEKIKWTFQLDKLGDLVTKGSADHFSMELLIDEQLISGSFSASATKEFGELDTNIKNRQANSVFLPAKEVLSLSSIIRTSRTRDHVFGFDDTYLDLVNYLDADVSLNNSNEDFSSPSKDLSDLMGGKIDRKDNQWVFKKANKQFSIHATAEGIKKIAILDRLIRNNTITRHSILFIDEPEAVLHPKAIVEFMNVIQSLTELGVQVFIATHSYFVIKKLQLIANDTNTSIPVISLKNHAKEVNYFDLKDDMPSNPIMDVSIALYEEQIMQQLND